jgi:integrase
LPRPKGLQKPDEPSLGCGYGIGAAAAGISLASAPAPAAFAQELGSGRARTGCDLAFLAGKEPLSVATRRLAHAVLHRALRDAVRWGRLVRNPADMADPPAAARSRAQAWTARDLGRFLAHVRGDRLYPLWRLAATTGMRRGELAGLTWRCLDLDAAVLSVEQQLLPTRGGCTFGPPKSDRSRRTIALDPGTVEVLAEHREAQLAERAFAGPAYVDADLVVCGRARRSDPPAAPNVAIRPASRGGWNPRRDPARAPAHGRDLDAHEWNPRPRCRRPAG